MIEFYESLSWPAALLVVFGLGTIVGLVAQAIQEVWRS